MDETSQRIIDAMMVLVRDKGYVATTTKDIARLAGVNECTLFRKFKNKKDIVLSGVSQEKWRADMSPAVFQNVKWELQSDLAMFMNEYMNRITPDFVNLSIGLRAPQLYDETAPMVMKVPQSFMVALIDYFEKMEEKGKIGHMDFECLALTIFTSTFGYTFLNASFDQNLAKVTRENFIKTSVELFVKGIIQM